LRALDRASTIVREADMTQPPRDGDRAPGPPQPNVLRDPARPGPNRPVANRLAAMADAGRRARLPGVSGRSSAVILLILFVAVAVVLPLALHRSAWVEAEIVVAAWFVIWTAVLTWLGYSGRTVDDDWGGFHRPRRLFGRSGGSSDGSPLPVDVVPYVDLGGIDLPDFDGGSDDGGLGCLGVIAASAVVIGAVAAVVVLLYFTIGYVIPLVALALYTIVRAMLNRVAARGHVTQGNLALSIARGAVWAAVFTAPLAIAIWLLHLAL
jgi:hypothetical protein